MLYRKQEKKPVGFKYDYGTNDAQQDKTQGKTEEEEEEQELIKDILFGQSWTQTMMHLCFFFFFSPLEFDVLDRVCTGRHIKLH